MSLTKEKTLYGTELLANGDMRSIYKIKVYDNGNLVSEYKEIGIIDAREELRIKDACGELVIEQLKKIAEKHSEIEALKEEKAVLLSEKLALVDEVELHKAENAEIKLNLKE